MTIILDKQFDELPKDVRFCRNCVVSNQRPRTEFNPDGLCSACVYGYEKDHRIDWEARERELQALCDRFRSPNGDWDVVVPGSGGKDSAYVAHQLKTKYGMHPLCVTWAPFEYTEIGWRNLQNFIHAGFTNLTAQPDQSIHRRLSRLAFRVKGDAWEPFTYGQKAWAFHVALRFGIKLMMYGENGEVEYGGRDKYKYLPKEDPKEWEYQYFKGSGVDSLVKIGLEDGTFRKDEVDGRRLQLYRAPDPELIQKSGLEMHWFSYYRKWTPQENFYYAATHLGFETNPEGRSEATYTKYASLDDKADGYHFYLGYMKFGMGRCTRDAHQDIRRHHITREEGVALVHRYDHEFPKRHYRWFLNYLGITEEQFWEVMDLYRSRSNVWQKINGEWKLKSIVS
jgi:N-acetyl sugar amidotransferase